MGPRSTATLEAGPKAENLDGEIGVHSICPTVPSIGERPSKVNYLTK